MDRGQAIVPTLRLRRTALGLSACLVTALVIAACGGDDDAKPTTIATRSGNTDATTAPTNEPENTSEPENTASNGGNTGDFVDNGNGVACSLVTTAQVSEATGTAMNDGVGLGGVEASYSNCRWDAQTGTATLSLDFLKQDAQLYYTEGSDNEGKTDIAGIGEKARWSTLLSSMEVVQGDYYFAVYVHTASNEDNLAAATAVATNVLESLP